jgi:hypothetical protein
MIPPYAPDKIPADRKVMKRFDCSFRRYHVEMMKRIAGLNPASITPRRTRIPRSCAGVLTSDINAATEPQREMRNGM